jgi:uncharacterized protein
MTSSAQRNYLISVALPDGYTKDHAPYPVLYAADANAEFGTVVETARLLSVSKELPDLVIVGVGYPNPGQGFKAAGAARFRDLTPTADPAFMQEFANAAQQDVLLSPSASGGAAEFLSFIRGELVPTIEQTYNVSPENRAWFGHSLGGLFGVYMLFNNDGLFRRFVIGSPSLFWNNRSMLAAEEVFAASGSALRARVFLSVGLLEEPSMVSDLRTFVATLERRRYQGLELQAQFFGDETHLSSVPAAISRGLRFVYSMSAPNPALHSTAAGVDR